MRTTRMIHFHGGRYHARFHNIWYWVFGLWALEVVFWTAVGLVWLTAVLVTLARAHRVNRRML